MTRTRYAYDTEFLENGRTIDLISIGIVADDGREYYAINADMPVARIREHEWLMANVVPFLPLKQESLSVQRPGIDMIDRGRLGWVVDVDDPRVKPYSFIAREVLDFLADGEYEPELWAYCGAYDHVVYAQLWGPMAQLPNGLPRRTNDIAQSLDEFDAWRDMPRQDSATTHDALADARHVMEVLKYLDFAKQAWLLDEATKLAEKGHLG